MYLTSRKSSSLTFLLTRQSASRHPSLPFFLRTVMSASQAAATACSVAMLASISLSLNPLSEQPPNVMDIRNYNIIVIIVDSTFLANLEVLKVVITEKFQSESFYSMNGTFRSHKVYSLLPNFLKHFPYAWNQLKLDTCT